MVMYVNESGTKEKLIKFKPRIKLNQDISTMLDTCCNKQASQKLGNAGLEVLLLQCIVVLCCC